MVYNILKIYVLIQRFLNVIFIPKFALNSLKNSGKLKSLPGN